jgi:hypothetical protein
VGGLVLGRGEVLEGFEEAAFLVNQDTQPQVATSRSWRRVVPPQ